MEGTTTPSPIVLNKDTQSRFTTAEIITAAQEDRLTIEGAEWLGGVIKALSGDAIKALVEETVAEHFK